MYDSIINDYDDFINNAYGLIPIINLFWKGTSPMKKACQFLFLISIIFLFGCQAKGQSIESVLTPDAGKAAIHGKVLADDESPLTDVVVRLAKVYRSETNEDNGTFILDEANSPSTISGEDGEYTFMNIEPGEYVLFIGQLHTEYMVVSDMEQNPKVYEVGEGEVLRIEPIIAFFD